MPHDLFGDVGVRSTSPHWRKPSVAFFTALAHVIVLASVLIAPLVADGDPLPAVARVIDYFEPARITIVVPPPAPRAARPGPPSPARATDITDTEPIDLRPSVEAPTGIPPERSGGGVPRGAGDSPTMGVDGGLGNTIAAMPTPAPTPQPVRVFEGFNMPVKIVDRQPIYPALALRVHVEGTVVIDATIDVAGNVVGARVLRGVPMLDQAALDAVKQWKFTPTRLNGRLVPVILTVTVNFRLR